MNATAFVKYNTDFDKVLNHYGINLVKKGKYYRGKCPLHNGDNPSAFVWNTENNLWFCHTNCGGGDIFDFIVLKEELSFLDSVRFLANILGLDISNMTLTERPKRWLEETKMFLRYMRKRIMEVKTLPFDFTQLKGNMEKVTYFRHFNEDILTNYNLQYNDYYNRYMIPIFDENNNIVGYTCRTSLEVTDFNAKWINLPEGLLTSEFVYNINNVESNKPIRVVEGVFDVWNMVQYGQTNTVGTFGCHITDTQMDKLSAKTFDLDLLFDPDKAGIKATLSLIPELKKKFNLRIGMINLDPCELKEKVKSIEYVKPHEFIKEYGGKYGKYTNNANSKSRRKYA